MARARVNIKAINEAFERDLEDLRRNREKYHGIQAKPENCSFQVYVNGKYKGSGKRLEKAYEILLSAQESNGGGLCAVASPS